jgi:hypothetical protein
MDKNPFTIEMALEFHRRMASIVDAVQSGVWKAGLRDLIGYDSDFGFGQKRGVQTLVLKSSHRSAYVRLNWDAILGESATDRALVDEAIQRAINALV